MNHPIPKSWVSHFNKLLLTALWVFVLKSSAVSQKSEPTPEKASNGLPISNELTSVASCLTSGCHGSRQLDAPLWQRAGRIWFDDDPHAKAYSHLLTERSLQIGEKLLHRSFRSDQDEDYQTFLEQRSESIAQVK